MYTYYALEGRLQMTDIIITAIAMAVTTVAFAFSHGAFDPKR